MRRLILFGGAKIFTRLVRYYPAAAEVLKAPTFCISQLPAKMLAMEF